MAICKFYANGYCKFGDQCRFDHVDPHQPNRSLYSKTYNQNNHGNHNSIQNQHHSSTRHHESNYPLQQHSRHHEQQQPQQRSHHQSSTFSFTKAASQISSSGSTFSFNRAAEQLPSNRPFGQQQQPQPQSTFSFGNTASNGFGSAGGSGSIFGNASTTGFGSANLKLDTSAKTFSFNQMLQKVEPTPQQVKCNSHFSEASIFGNSSSQTKAPSFFSGAQAASTLTGTGFPSQSKFTSFFAQASNTATRPAQTSIFGNTQSQSKPQQPSIFAPSSNTSTSFFANIKEQQSSLAANSSQTCAIANSKSKAYTPLDQLTDDDKSLFQQAEFNGLIPLQPPPIELCF